MPWDKNFILKKICKHSHYVQKQIHNEFKKKSIINTLLLMLESSSREENTLEVFI